MRKLKKNRFFSFFSSSEADFSKEFLIKVLIEATKIFFKSIEAIIDPSGEHGFMFGFSTTTLTIKEEAYLYPFESFLVEAGGSLGLFLGFSFLNLWQVFVATLIQLWRTLKRRNSNSKT